ncbi:hypothetical protein GE061_018345 [Apolygus lucorum]|uniref:Cytochrome P450 n=1 Tax=Apolygus lucorum TaxID=248454 RepID=A0A8S9XGB5_APOLU|nr:hypothetical protein GE061_018345 [Apolygus lucorum]
MLVVASILVVLFLTVCHLNNQICLYWKKRGIPFIPATSLFSKDIIRSFLLTPALLSEIYDRSKGKSFIGFFQMREPVLMVCTPDVINAVLNKDFHSFSSTRKSECSSESDPLSQHLLALDGEKWKNIRSRLTPAFTSGKLKSMFPIIDSHVDEFLQFLEKHQGESIDAEEICSCLSITNILSCSFGLQTECQNPNNARFIQVGKKAFEAGFWTLLKARFRMMFPRLFNLLKLKGYVSGHANFCADFVREVIEHRKMTGFHRPDFVEILMKLRSDEVDKGEDGKSLSDSLIIAQVFSFLVAGYETTTTTLSCALFELAQDAHAAEKLRTEAQDAMELCGSLNYESVNSMDFLDRVIKEVLRKHPPVIFIPRVCTKKTTIPGTSALLEEGTQLLIPVLALHRDPKYYPYPDEFLPQRFTSHSAKLSLPDTPYLPFSEGPRKCIGMRFALLELKIALAKIVMDFDLKLDETSPKVITVEEFARTYKMKNRIKLIFKRKSLTSQDSCSTT